MKEFPIFFEICLGYHCCGCGEYVGAEGSVQLEESQVDQLVALIKDNGGETDIDKIRLKEKYPDIYSALEEAYSDAAGTAVYRHWLIEGYECGYFDEPEGIMEAMEADGLFKYKPEEVEDVDEIGGDEIDEDITTEDEISYAKEDAFEDWKEEYFDSLSEDEQVAFIEKYYGKDLVNEYGPDGGEYSIEIPQEIIDVANVKDA